MFLLHFFKTDAGREPVREWIRGLDGEDRKVIGTDLRTVQFGFPVGMPLCRPLGDGLHELRTSLPSKREARLIFFQDGQMLIILDGFIKKTKETPAKQLQISRRRRSAYLRNKSPPTSRQTDIADDQDETSQCRLLP